MKRKLYPIIKDDYETMYNEHRDLKAKPSYPKRMCVLSLYTLVLMFALIFAYEAFKNMELIKTILFLYLAIWQARHTKEYFEDCVEDK